MTLALFIGIAYLLGSIPFGLLVSRCKGIDLRKEGSGNIGAANAIRTLGFGCGLLVLLGDMLKSMSALFLAEHFLGATATPLALVLVGLAAIMGHNYSIFLGFKGGKGVAATLGVFLFLAWKATVAAFAVWLVVVAITRYASLGSILSAILLPFSMIYFHAPVIYVDFAAAAALLIVYKHRGNVVRLWSGKENRLVR